MLSWLSRLAGQSSYLQLYWLLQTGRVAVLAVHRMITFNRPHVSHRDPERKRGWTEFRKQYVTRLTVLTTSMLWWLNCLTQLFC